MTQEFLFDTVFARIDESHNDLIAMLERGEVDEFIERFLDGLEAQVEAQEFYRALGSPRRIGEATRARVKRHLLRFWAEAGRR